MPGRLILPAAALAAVLTLSAARAEPLSLDEAMALAERANPSLAAERLQVPVAQAGIGVARQRPNPELALEEDRETPHDALSLTFPIETGGKRGKRIDVAEAAVGTSQASLAKVTIEVRAKVRRAYFGLAAAERSAAEAQGMAALAARSRDAVRERVKSGDAPRLEQLQTEMAAAQNENEAVTALALAASRRAELNVLLGRATDAETTTAGDLGEGVIPDLATATATALSHNGDLTVLEGRLREQNHRVSLARAQRWPDFGVMGAVTHRDPEFDWGWRAGVSLTLPVFHNHGAEAKLEEATLAQLTAEREAQIADVRSKVASAWTLADARGKQYARYRDEILPTAREVESMAEESYHAGQTGLVELIQAISAVRDARGRAVDAGLSYQEALADLEEEIGAPIP
ncbi:MAG TPA: TolC family protein [Candidatus Polarisedimenticolaceae bacterium]|nr:TolC family protein [Candidatus Polarisedimenticolaceae bacterium]